MSQCCASEIRLEVPCGLWREQKPPTHTTVLRVNEERVLLVQILGLGVLFCFLVTNFGGVLVCLVVFVPSFISEVALISLKLTL